MQILDLIFMAVVVTLFLANWRLQEVKMPRKVFGKAKLTPPKTGFSILDYVAEDLNLSRLVRYFYFRNVLKTLFFLFCISSVIYGALILFSIIKINPVAQVLPIGVEHQPISILVQSEGASFHGNRYNLKSSLIFSKTTHDDIAVYSFNLDERDGQLIWLSGNGALTEINIATIFQVFGVLSIFLGIATFAYATVLRQDNE